MRILDYFPKQFPPRPQQVEVLEALEAGWQDHDVFIARCPTAVGKTEVQLTVARWLAARGVASNSIQPTNILVEQFVGRYPEIAVLRRKDAYECETDFKTAKRTARVSLMRLMNTHVYLAHKLYAPVVMFDEAHQLLDMLQDKQDVKLWRSQWGFPTDLRTVADVIAWAQDKLLETPDDRLTRALREIVRIEDGAVVVYKQQRRKRTADTLLHVIPSTARSVPPWLWPPHRVSKLVLLSATIGEQDVRDLGLANRRVKYIECDSPIPVERRPVIYEPSYNLSRECVPHALPVLARKLEELLARHPDKGLVHLPYGLAEQLRELTRHPRLLFHNRDDKAAVLERFKTSAPSDGLVLVASGMFEGLDLKYDDARWQVIAKTPYLNLGDPRVAERAKKEPTWYAWSAIRSMLQATGRIVRAVDDQGTTYILDNTFDGLRRRHWNLFPAYFRAAFKEKR